MYINNNKLNLILDKADGTCFNVKNVSLKRVEYWLFTISKSIMELHKKRKYCFTRIVFCTPTQVHHAKRTVDGGF